MDAYSYVNMVSAWFHVRLMVSHIPLELYSVRVHFNHRVGLTIVGGSVNLIPVIKSVGAVISNL